MVRLWIWIQWEWCSQERLLGGVNCAAVAWMRRWAAGWRAVHRRQKGPWLHTEAGVVLVREHPMPTAGRRAAGSSRGRQKAHVQSSLHHTMGQDSTNRSHLHSCYNMDEPWKDHAEWKETGHKRPDIVGFHLYEKSRSGKSVEMESRWVAAEGWGTGKQLIKDKEFFKAAFLRTITRILFFESIEGHLLVGPENQFCSNNCWMERNRKYTILI